MAKDSNNDWQEATAQTLARTDIRGEYEGMGLRTRGDVSSTGYVTCHAIDREDKTPSARIFVGDGPKRGRYRDYGPGGQSLGFFDFAAEYGPYSDWRKAREHFASKAGVKLPRSAEKLKRDLFEFYPLTPTTAKIYAATKPPIKGRAIIEAGGRANRWPASKRLSAQRKQHLIVFPARGAGGLDQDPVG